MYVNPWSEGGGGSSAHRLGIVLLVRESCT